MSRRIHINAVAYKEDGAWIAQGIEYDIVAHAHDVLELTDAFSRAVAENLCISDHLGHEGLAKIKRAPKHFQKMFEGAAIEVRPTKQTGDADVAVRVNA
jgi:hypothetical protein